MGVCQFLPPKRIFFYDQPFGLQVQKRGADLAPGRNPHFSPYFFPSTPYPLRLKFFLHICYMGYANFHHLKRFFSRIIRLAYRSKNVVWISASAFSSPILPSHCHTLWNRIFSFTYVKLGYANFYPQKEFSSWIIGSAYRSKNVVRIWAPRAFFRQVARGKIRTMFLDL